MRTLSGMQPLNPEQVIDPSWRPAGLAPNGKQLFELRRRRSRSVPDIDPQTGMPRYTKHPITGEPLLQKRKPELYEEVLLFYEESDGQGNRWKIEYRPPTADEVARQEREQRIRKILPDLAGALVDTGLTPDELVLRLTQPAWTQPAAPQPPAEAVAQPAPPAAVPAPRVTYPLMIGPKTYLLSNQERFQGSKQEAIEAEKRVQEALQAVAEDRAEAAAAAAVTPDY